MNPNVISQKKSTLRCTSPCTSWWHFGTLHGSTRIPTLATDHTRFGDNDDEDATAFYTSVVTRTIRKAKLSVNNTLGGPAQPAREVMIEREKVTVGRSEVCDLRLGDSKVSGIHFEVVSDEKGFLVRDLNSTNGTFINGIQIKEAWIKEGSYVTVGGTELKFEVSEGLVDIEMSPKDTFFGLSGKGPRMREIFATLERAAPSDLSVLIHGETGSGKELVARAIHRASRRSNGPMIVQDCSAVAKDRIESTLFGHEKGSFSGATERHVGSFEQANHGTIFLDELGELDLGLQPKLLRVLENREIRRLGGDKNLPVDVRVIAATHRDLRKMVNNGSFREDLYYRLHVVQIELPPLRERTEDIPFLVDQFLQAASQKKFPNENKRFVVTPEAMKKMMTYPWPGNIRELKNMIERAVMMAETQTLQINDLLPGFRKSPTPFVPGGSAEQFVEEGMSFKEAKQKVIDAFESGYIKALLDRHGGNITHSAQAAGLTRFHLRERAKYYGIRDTDD